MTTNNPKLQLNLNEENELAFKVSIEGSTSEMNSTKPNVRFVLGEQGAGRSWLYPAKKDDDGYVSVNIPSEDFFSEEKEYKGQLEVILGNHYFVPTEVDIEFVRPLKVEASVVDKKNNDLQEEKDKSDEASVEVSSVQVRNNKKQATTEAHRASNKASSEKSQQPKRKAGTKKRNWEDLTKEEQEYVKRKLKEKKLAEAKRKKLEEQKRKKLQQQQKQKKAKQQTQLKDQIKTLMADSLLSDDE